MKTIVIKTQKELDILPSEFKEYTIIEIRADKLIKVSKAYYNSSVQAYGNSSVVACNNSSVIACNNSSVIAYDNSSVEAWDNSSVRAWNNSSVQAYNDSSVQAWGSSSVLAYGNSSVEAYDNSSVIAWDNSSVRAWGSSSVRALGDSSIECYDFSVVTVKHETVTIRKLFDYSVASLRGIESMVIKDSHTTATIKTTPINLNHSFETYLERGIVYADGIMKQLISKRRYKGLDVFKVKEYSGKKYSYVVKRGNTFAHAETVKKAIEDLRYKISDRDLTKFNKLTLKSKLKIDDAIQCYRMITGACELGTREFVEKHKLPKTITIDKIIKLTKGQFGNDAFKEFFKGK